MVFLDEKFCELLVYWGILWAQIGSNHKESYFFLIDEYLAEVIPPAGFWFKFLQIRSENYERASLFYEDFQKLEVLSFTDDLDSFNDLIYKIFDLCFVYYVTYKIPSIHILNITKIILEIKWKAERKLLTKILDSFK